MGATTSDPHLVVDQSRFSEVGVRNRDLSKTARGYGLAFPDLETHPVFLIENPITGLVIDTTDNGSGSLVAVPKVGKSRLSQCWRLEREEKGFIVRNAASGNGFHVPAANGDAGTILVMWSVDRTKEVVAGSLFKLTEVHREITIETTLNGLILDCDRKEGKGHHDNLYHTGEEGKETVAVPTLEVGRS